MLRNTIAKWGSPILHRSSRRLRSSWDGPRWKWIGSGNWNCSAFRGHDCSSSVPRRWDKLQAVVLPVAPADRSEALARRRPPVDRWDVNESFHDVDVVI